MASHKTAPKLYEFYSIIHDKEKMVKFMRDKNLLPSSMKCGSCGEQMNTSKKSSKSDGEKWKCVVCMSTTIRKNTLFEV